MCRALVVRPDEDEAQGTGGRVHDARETHAEDDRRDCQGFLQPNEPTPLEHADCHHLTNKLRQQKTEQVTTK